MQLEYDYARLAKDKTYRSQLNHLWRKEEATIALSALINRRVAIPSLLQRSLIDKGKAFIKVSIRGTEHRRKQKLSVCVYVNI